jgi:hypothetical protein
MIFLESPFVELRAMAVLAANGGGGAGIAIGSSGKAAQLDGQPAAGGGAVDAGTPGNGAAGDSPTGVSPTVACGFQEGLGAGGAAGRIVINTKSGTPTLNATSIVSPSIKSSAASFGKADLH